MSTVIAFLLVMALGAAQAKSAPSFTTPLTLEQMSKKQGVVETSMGTFVIELLPQAAPNHVGHFIKQARDGAYNGTVFHRVIKYGIIQGGDPISRDPAKSAQYGTGGMNVLKGEINQEKHTAGAVSAVLAPGRPDSGGAQFFICATDQLALDGKYTLFARVVEGIEVVQAISAVEADATGRPAARVTITSVTIRDTPPPVAEPFVTATVEEMARHHAVLETTMGEIEVEFFPDKAPETVRNFLRLSQAGVYDDTPVHRVVPGFMMQTGSLAHRRTPLTLKQHALVRTLPPEFTNTPNVPGILSMARGDDPASGSTSFFICTGECRALDSKYTAFGRVIRGMDVVTAIGATPVEGETPRTLILVRAVTLKVNR